MLYTVTIWVLEIVTMKVFDIRNYMEEIAQPRKRRKKQKEPEKPIFHLPQSSLKKINNIIKGYFQILGVARYKEVAESIGERNANVTVAHGFLKDLKIIEGGDYQKSISSLGRELGKALSFEGPEEVKREWRKVIENNKFCMQLLIDIKQMGKVTRKEFQNRIFSSANYFQIRADHRVGANTLIQIFELAGYVSEQDGNYIVSASEKELWIKQHNLADIATDYFIAQNHIAGLEKHHYSKFDTTRLVK